MSQRISLIIVSFVLIIEGLSYLLCIPFAIHFHESLKPFLVSSLIFLLVGISFLFISNKKFKNFTDNKKIILTIIFSWFILILGGTLPYLISESIPSFVDALFESVSGYTSTGSSIISNIDQIPKSILFWRSFTQWLGGLSTIVMITSLFPSLEIGGYRLFSLVNWFLSSKKLFILRISLIYFFLTVIQTTVLYFEGVDLFNGLCYSFGTVSTGCFSPGETNITSYSSLVQSTLVFFMFLSGISYLFYYRLAFKKLKLKNIDDELKVYIILVVVGILVVIVGTHGVHYVNSFGNTIMKAFFQVISVVSSSGYFVSDYSIFPDFILTVIFFYLFIGGCSNTSSGGIKISRLIVLFRNIWQQFKSPDLSTNVSSVKYNSCTIDTKTNLSILTFISLFGATFIFGGIAMSFFGYGLKESAFLSISALSTFGHNLDLSQFPDFGKLILTLLMLLGRLEIYPVIVLFIPFFYKKNQSVY